MPQGKKRASATTTFKPPTSLRFAVLKDLTNSGRSSPAEALHRLGELLGPSKVHGTLHLRLLQSGAASDASAFSVTFGKAKGKSTPKAALKRTVEIITTPETWAEIAGGRMAPHDAFLSGRMRMRGNVALAQTLIRHVAGSAGITSLCGEEEA
jgi:putative sterol carrier protein